MHMPTLHACIGWSVQLINQLESGCRSRTHNDDLVLIACFFQMLQVLRSKRQLTTHQQRAMGGNLSTAGIRNSAEALFLQKVCVDNYSRHEYIVEYFGVSKHTISEQAVKGTLSGEGGGFKGTGTLEVLTKYEQTGQLISKRTLRASLDGKRVRVALDKFGHSHVFIALKRGGKLVATSIVEGNNKWVIDANGNT